MYKTISLKLWVHLARSRLTIIIGYYFHSSSEAQLSFIKTTTWIWKLKENLRKTCHFCAVPCNLLLYQWHWGQPSICLSITPITNHQILAKYYSSLSLHRHCHRPCLCHYRLVRISAVTCFSYFSSCHLPMDSPQSRQNHNLQMQIPRCLLFLATLQWLLAWTLKADSAHQLSTIWLLPSLGSFLLPSYLGHADLSNSELNSCLLSHLSSTLLQRGFPWTPN